MNYKYHDSNILRKAEKAKEIIELIISHSSNKIDLIKIPRIEYTIDDKFCENCDACFDALFYGRLIDDFLNGLADIKKVEIDTQTWKYSTLIDKSVHGLGQLSDLKFDRSDFNTNKKLVYIDQNVLSTAVNEARFLDQLINLIKESQIQFICSPSHAEEIYKIDNEYNRSKFIETIYKLTDYVTLQPDIKSGKIKLFHEKTSVILSRIEKTADATKAIEQTKVLKNKDREIHFPQYEDLQHRKVLGNSRNIFDALTDDEFSALVSMSAPPGTNKSSFKNLSSHHEIRDAIYSLHNAMDLMAFKQDKNERKLCSSIHDVEHLIYASQCSFFVTKDGNLKKRAEEIYNFLGFTVSVITPDLIDSEIN